jgi:hypothetical protein
MRLMEAVLQSSSNCFPGRKSEGRCLIGGDTNTDVKLMSEMMRRLNAYHPKYIIPDNAMHGDLAIAIYLDSASKAPAASNHDPNHAPVSVVLHIECACSGADTKCTRKQDPPHSTIPNMSDATERARQSAHTVAASSPEVPEEACPDTPQATTPSINAATERTHKPDPKRMITFTEQESGLRVSPSDLELEMPTDLDTKPAFYLAL